MAHGEGERERERERETERERERERERDRERERERERENYRMGGREARNWRYELALGMNYKPVILYHLVIAQHNVRFKSRNPTHNQNHSAWDRFVRENRIII